MVCVTGPIPIDRSGIPLATAHKGLRSGEGRLHIHSVLIVL